MAGGSALLLRFDSAPGGPGGPPPHWPRASGIAPSGGKSTLVLFMHPKCPCSRATLAELARIVEENHGGLAVCVEFVTPAAASADWNDTWSHRRAAAMPGVRIAADPSGVEARRFGVETSGHVLVYDPRGNLAFSGGITRARGHEGANLGRSAVACLAAGATPEVRQTRVFGCPLMGP